LCFFSASTPFSKSACSFTSLFTFEAGGSDIGGDGDGGGDDNACGKTGGVGE
jgi:hypothetical protein